MRALKIIIQGAFISIVLLCIGVFFAPSLPIIGHLEFKIVKSGSMEPTIMTGGVVMVRERSTYQVGEVVTYTSNGSAIPTTHRIVGTETAPDGATYFVTKGDANEERDVDLLVPSNIIGEVIFSVPYVGFVLDFARQPLGFFLIIGIPAFLIVVDEIDKIWREVRRRRSSVVVSTTAEPPIKDKLDEEKLPVTRSEIRFRIVCFLSILSALAAGLTITHTLAYYADSHYFLANLLETAAVDFQVSPASAELTFINGESETGTSIMLTTDLVADSADLLYSLRVAFVAGNQLLCDGLGVSITDPFNYTGPLTGLGATAVSAPSVWQIALSFPDGVAYPSGDYCQVELVFSGWQAEFPELYGYQDEERVLLTVYTQTFVADSVEIQPLLQQLTTVISPEDDAPSLPGTTQEETTEEAKPAEAPESAVTEETTEEVVPTAAPEPAETEEAETGAPVEETSKPVETLSEEAVSETPPPSESEPDPISEPEPEPESTLETVAEPSEIELEV